MILRVGNVILFGENVGVRGLRKHFFAPKFIKISNLDTISFHKNKSVEFSPKPIRNIRANMDRIMMCGERYSSGQGCAKPD